MPIYRFECEACKIEYEELTSYDDTNKYEKVLCPECGSGHKTKLFPTSFSFQFAQPVGTDRWNNSHDYRYKYEQPKVRSQREVAEKASNVGASPYSNINDLETDSNYDFSKI